MKRGLGTILWSFILIGIGALFLLGNFFPEFRPWRLVARYWSAPWLLFARFWPVLIIFWGVSKLGSYFKGAQDPSIGRRSRLSGGDVVLLVFLLIFGTAATSITRAVRGSISLEKSWDGPRFGIDDDIDFSDSGTRFEFSEELSQPVSGHVVLDLVNRHGSVELLSHNLPQLKIRLAKRIRAEDEARGREIADQLKIVIEKNEHRFRLSTTRESLPQDWRRGMQTNFTVWVPKSTALKISNRYGAVTLDGVSGSHEVANANGPVNIQNVDGSLKVENRYGPITIFSITGDCTVKNKYGPVTLEGVSGKTEVENAYGPVSLKQLKGSATLSNRYGNVVCVDLGSGLEVDAQYAPVSVHNIAGDVQIQTSYKRVELENVLGGIHVKGKHGDIDIKSSQPPVRPIVVETEYGGVDIVIPRDSRFDVEISSKYGQFISGFDSVNVTESVSGKSLRFRGSRGQGGPPITVHTTYRNISLKPS